MQTAESTQTTAPASLRALLTEIVDYAGLFPPSALEMAEAVARYAAARTGADAWMLGRFVLPAARLAEFEAAAAPWLASATGEPWRLSALVGAEREADFARVDEFDARLRGRAVIDAVELRAGTAEDVAAATRVVPAGIIAYFEVAPDPGCTPLLAAVRDGRGRAKIRTGGVTPDAFPAPAEVLRFLEACAQLDLPLKATAGLHHPLRAEHALTYAPDAPRGVMFGFLNVFLAAAFLRAGLDARAVAPLLEETDPAALRFGENGVRWREHELTTAGVEAARRGFAISFGSCSFDEPVSDLRAFGLLK